MINKPTPFKGLNTRIPTIIPINGRGVINHGSTLNPLLIHLIFHSLLPPGPALTAARVAPVLLVRLESTPAPDLGLGV